MDKTIPRECPTGRRWFTWKPQWFYSWPVKIVRGEDEYNWRTLGIVTWAGSFFIRTSRCFDAECLEASRDYWQWADEEGLT